MAEPEFLRTTRASYDAVAVEYAERFQDELAGKPLDRALLTGFAELVQAGGGRPVADVGSGPGRTTAFLHRLGLDVFGIDLSPQMVELARREHPGVRFEVGSMLGLDLPDGGLGGLLANYSIIHVPLDRLPEVFAEFHRVLAPGGHVLVVFQVGDEPLRFTEAFGHSVSLEFHRRRPDQIAELMNQAGLVVGARMVREPEEGVEKTPQAYLFARKPTQVSSTGH